MTEEKPPPTTQWQERTVERSLRVARERAVSRGNKFIAATTELLRSTGKADFTVQEVVNRSGMSLRSFYQHFATKDDLLLAILEESVRQYLAVIRPQVEAESDPAQQLRVLLRGVFGSPESDDPASRGLVLFHWHLADTRTDEFAATIAPQVELIEEIIAAGVDSGQFRTDIPVPTIAALLTNTLLSLLDMRVLGVKLTEQPVTADELILWCTAAVIAPE